jgi:hypothetical protein
VPFHANRHTIDASGDCIHNDGRAVTDARDEALAKGVTINGLVIMSEQLNFHNNPPGGLGAYYRNIVIGGLGAFVMVAENFSSFAETILSKLNAEIAPKGTKVDTGAKDAGAVSKQQRDKLPRPVTHKRSQRTPHK